MRAGHGEESGTETGRKDGIVGALMQLTSFVEDPHLAKTADWPDEIGGFRVLDELAWSGQAVAFLAYDAQLKRNVVLKMYYGSKSDRGRDAILAEGQKLAMVSSPNVARCFGTGQYSGSPFLVLEHIDGVTLADTAAVNESEAATLVREIARGLQSIHDAGLAHGDIKPSNVVVDKKGVPHLIDMGSSTGAGATGVETPSTAAYLAPERAGRIDGFSRAKADIFSLGGVLYFLLTGRAPFEAATTQDALSLSRSRTITPVRVLAPNAPEKLVRICEKCMDFDPNQRFASADEVASALEVPGRPLKKLAVPAIIGILSAVCVAGMLWAARRATASSEAGSRQESAAGTSNEPEQALSGPEESAGVPHVPPPTNQPATQPRTQAELLQSALEQGLKAATMGRNDDSLAPTIQFASDDSEASLASLPLDEKNRVVLGQPVSGKVRFVIAPTKAKPTWVQILSYARDAKGTLNQTPVTVDAKSHAVHVRVDNDPVKISTQIEYFGGQTEYLAILTATTAWDEAKALDKTWAVLSGDSATDTHRGVGKKIRYKVRVFEYVVKPVNPRRDYRLSLEALKNGDVDKAKQLGSKLKALAADPLTNNRSEIGSDADYVLKLCELDADLRTQITAADERVTRYGNPMGQATFSGPIQVLVDDYELMKEHLGETHLKTADSLYLLSLYQYEAAGQDADRKEKAADQLWRVRNIFHEQLGAHPRTHQRVEFSSMLLVSKDDPAAMRFASENHILATAIYGPDSTTPQPVRIGHAMVQKAAALIRNSRWVDGRQTCFAANEILKDSLDPLQCIGFMTMGQILAEEGDHERAIEYFEKAAAGFERMHMVANQVEVLGFAADSHLLLGDTEGCLLTIDRAREVANKLRSETTGKPNSEAEQRLFESEVTFAKVLLRDGRRERAIELLRGQVAKCRNRSGKGQLDVAMRELADALTAAGELVESAEIHAGLIERATRGKPCHNVQGLALCRELAGRNAEAFELYAEAFEGYLHLARALTNQQSAFQRFQYTERIRQNLAGLLRTGSDKPGRILYKFVFRSKGLASRTLAQQYLAARRSPEKGQAKRELRRRRDALFSSSSATRNSLRDLQEIERESEKIERTLTASAPEEFSQSMDRVLAELPGNTAIIDFVKIGRSHTGEAVPPKPVAMAFVISRNDNDVRVTHELISSPKGMDADWGAHWAGSRGVGVGTATTPVTDKSTSSDEKKKNRRQDALNGISNAVQQTLAQIPDRVNHVVVCPDTGMHRVPWAALKKDGRYLVDRHAITFSESARDFLATASSLDDLGDTMLVVGGVDFKGTADDLPHSLVEAHGIAALHKRNQVVTVLSKDAVTVQALHDKLGAQSNVHLATHAHYGLDQEQLARRNPLLAAYIVVSGGAKIHGDEIASWNLSGTRLVTLSACEGADGKAITGEGVLGLERSLRFAGALEVISSLVRVNDLATKEFMLELNKNLLVMAPMQALQATQRQWIHDKKPIATWANWRLSR